MEYIMIFHDSAKFLTSLKMDHAPTPNVSTFKVNEAVISRGGPDYKTLDVSTTKKA